MNERMVIITGANSGIGKAAALKFAIQGYRVIMACRNLGISSVVQKEIMEAANNHKVDLMKLDTSSFTSIREFCAEYRRKYQRLDILIHNAAYFNHGEKKYQLSSDNLELTFATNTFGPYLLTILLKDLLAKSDDPRILHACTTNIRHFFDPKRKIDFDNLQGENKESKKYRVYKMYGDSKMALLMLTFKMADEFKKDSIKVNAIQIPAIRMSEETLKKFSYGWRIIARIQNSFAHLPSTMGDTYFHICTSKEFKNITGKLINEKRESMKSSHYGSGIIDSIKQFSDKNVYPKYADDRQTNETVWMLSKELTERVKNL